MSMRSYIFSTWHIADHHNHTTHLPGRDTKNCQTPTPHPHSPQHTGHLGSPTTLFTRAYLQWEGFRFSSRREIHHWPSRIF